MLLRRLGKKPGEHLNSAKPTGTPRRSTSGHHNAAMDILNGRTPSSTSVDDGEGNY